MCGILGFFSDDRKVASQQFRQALDKLSHRGPDNCSVREFESGSLGHVRLAIIDLEQGSNQPFSVHQRFHIVYNGEIYNYKEVREELIRDYSEHFDTNSDTEVLLKAYIHLGEDCLTRINGMFAFAIFDKQENKIFAARDRVGKKPFYFFSNENTFAFASELKALLPLLPQKPRLSHYSINEFLSIGYIIAPNTIYEDIFKLKPANFLKIDLNSFQINSEEYWNPTQTKRTLDETNAKSLIEDAISIRYNSDVPVGIMLSGGLDSNIILALSRDRKPTTFTIKNDSADYDESDVASQSASYFGCENRAKTAAPDHSIIDKIITHYDEPMADSSAIPSLLLSKFIHSQNFKCVLNGDGADEIFAGYDRYKFLLLYKRYRFLRALIPKLPFAQFRYKGFIYNLNLLRRLFQEKNLNEAYAEQQIINKNFQGPALKKYDYKREIVRRLESISEKGLNRFIIHDFKYYLPDDLLVKMDRATMAFAVESRSPFLDYRLAEIFLNVKFEEKISLRKNKKHLRRWFGTILPKLITKKKKTGFQIPIDHWFLHELRDEVIKLKTGEMIKDGLVSEQYVCTIIDSHLQKAENFKFQIYLLLIFEKWYKKWVKG